MVDGYGRTSRTAARATKLRGTVVMPPQGSRPEPYPWNPGSWRMVVAARLHRPHRACGRTSRASRRRWPPSPKVCPPHAPTADPVQGVALSPLRKHPPMRKHRVERYVPPARLHCDPPPGIGTQPLEQALTLTLTLTLSISISISIEY